MATDALPVIIGAAIGAGGAVIAQVTSAVFTARRETERLKWERERQARDWKLRKSERFMSLKQELYSRYLSITYKPIMALSLLTNREYNDKPDWQKTLPRFKGSFEADLNALRSNIRLLAPPKVADRVEYAHALMLVAMLKAAINDSSLEWRHKLADDSLRAWQQLSDLMRADLRGDEEALLQLHEEMTYPHERPAQHKHDKAEAQFDPAPEG